MNITEHSVDNCIRRVMGIPPHLADSATRREAREMIQRAVDDPDYKHREEGNDVPIHVWENVAVPVEKTHVPTTYHADTFKDRIK